MKGLKKRLLVGAMALTVPMGLIAADFSMAADEDSSDGNQLAQAKGPLIDSEFENAVRVIITKRFCNRIDATDEQRAKLTALFKDTMQETRPLREQLRRKLLDVSSLMASSSATDDQIKAEVQSSRALRQQLMDKRIDTVLAVRKILTPEQRQKIHNRITEIISGNVKPNNVKPNRLGWIMEKLSVADNEI